MVAPVKHIPQKNSLLRLWIYAMSLFALAAGLMGCISVPPTVENDPFLYFVVLDGHKFHIRTVGNSALPPVIVVHGGPGGDSKSLSVNNVYV
jgi:hypothetical protein